MEECLKEESKNIFRENGFKITPPIEYNALKSIVVRHLDKVIGEYSDAEIMENINQTNQWVEVEEIYRIKTTGRMIKIRFKNTQMANKVAEEGMVIVYQNILKRSYLLR